MHFQHAPAVWRDFPSLVPGVLYAEGITGDAATGTDHLTAIAKARLADGPESEFPEIQAWRRAFARMGLKPTQYRCAAESLLRRFRKEGSLPRLHPWSTCVTRPRQFLADHPPDRRPHPRQPLLHPGTPMITKDLVPLAVPDRRVPGRCIAPR